MGGEKRVELCRDTRPITSVIRDLNIRRQLTFFEALVVPC